MAQTILEVKKTLTEYLMAKGLRKTTERYQILEEIYNQKEHFRAEDLFQELTENNFNISRATVYNTLDLLVECQLVSKIVLDGQTRYEKSFGYKQHDHLICNQCKKVFEFCDPRIMIIQKMVEEYYKFSITGHSLHFFGDCVNPKCPEKKKRKEKPK